MIGNTFRGTYTINRLLGKRLVSSDIELHLELDFDENASKIDQVAALERMKRWMDTILDECLAFNTRGDMPTGTIEALENHLMFCPDEPYDFLLMLLITSKLNSIGQGIVSVVHCQLSSDIGDGFGNWFEGDATEFLPTKQEWFGEKCYFDLPWWKRHDGSMIDMWADQNSDLSKQPDILIDLNSDVTALAGMDLGFESAEIIKPNFKPTIVDNDPTERQ